MEVRRRRSHLSCVAYDGATSVRQTRTRRPPAADPFCPRRNCLSTHWPEPRPVLAGSPAHASARAMPHPHSSPAHASARATLRPHRISLDLSAHMSAIVVVVRPCRICPPTRVGSAVAQPLHPPQPHGAQGNREIGRACSPSRTGPAAVAGSYTIATLMAAAARSASDTRAGSASSQGRRRALHIEINMELNFIIHLYTSKSCVYIHHTLYTSKFSPKL
jgi:hypothetical protein